MEYNLSTKAIAQIVQLIQLGILTGTDISDQLRTFRMTIDDKTNKLVPSEEFIKSYNENIERLAKKADSFQE